MTLPKTTWPTSLTSIPERATASRTHVAAISLGGASFRLPPYPPIAVRTPLRTTISRLILNYFETLFYFRRIGFRSSAPDRHLGQQFGERFPVKPLNHVSKNRLYRAWQALTIFCTATIRW